MLTGGGGGPSHPDRIAVALMGATFLLVALLLGQALLALRAQERVVDATLQDVATFAAERVAVELNSTFSAIFLDQIAAARSAHYAWLAGDRTQEAPRGSRPVPAGAIPTYFTIDGSRLVSRGEPPDPGMEAWILADVAAHAEDVYPRPAPYALLRASGPGGALAVAYRKEEAYERVGVYGFVIRFDRFGPTYRRTLDNLAILPASLSVGAEAEKLLSVALVFPQSEELLFSRPGPPARHRVSAQAIAGKAGRMAVRVELDAEAARAVVPGGTPAAPVALFVAFAALTLGLLAAAVALLRRASRLTRLRESFVANVSHDLRTPLAQIRMFSETLLLGRMADAGERRRALEIIRRQATSLSDLVDNVLHASGAGSPPVRRVPTDFEELLRDTTEALTPSAEAKRVTVVRAIQGPARATVDPTALRRIVINLVDNALKYGPVGQTITVTLRNRGGFVDVEVEDQGPGVPRRDRARVWERFSRVGAQEVGGTGIGLAVVRDLADRHGGEVRFEESPSGGGRVVVTLAVGEPAA